MEDVSTRVLEKIKNILEGKTEKWSDVSRHISLHMSKHKKIRFIIHSQNLQPNCYLKFHFQKVDQHAGGKWLIHDTKRRKDNQLQSLKLRCRISKKFDFQKLDQHAGGKWLIHDTKRRKDNLNIRACSWLIVWKIIINDTWFYDFSRRNHPFVTAQNSSVTNQICGTWELEMFPVTLFSDVLT